MGILYVVGTPIGNMSDMSSNALRVLNEVDLIACEDTRVSINLLRHFSIDKKLISYHKFNEKSKSESLIADLLSGRNVALITDAGCPCISDPGSILVHECLQNNIMVYAIPGPSAIITSLMSSGMDTSSFSFYGFLNRDHVARDLEKIKNDESNLLIIYESPKRIIKTLKDVMKIFDNPQICLCNDLTKKFEKKYYGLVSSVIDELFNNPNYELGEYVLIIENKKQNSCNDCEKASIESLLIDMIVKNNCTMKDAVKLVSAQYKYNKNVVYEASIHLKKMFEK